LVGFIVGLAVGLAVGALVGFIVGLAVGLEVGAVVGFNSPLGSLHGRQSHCQSGPMLWERRSGPNRLARSSGLLLESKWLVERWDWRLGWQQGVWLGWQ